jgi:CDGSH-type Zn-finger protein
MPEPGPLVCTLETGRHAICRCGQTDNPPFCDGQHVGTEFTPELVDVPAEQKLAWCTCRQTGTPPRCDGSHASRKGSS